MDSPERSRSFARRDTQDNSDVKSERVGDDEEWESSDKRKHRPSKSRKSSYDEKAEVLEGSRRSRSSTDRNENRKRSSGSSKVGSDDDEYVARRELHARQMKKKQEESSLEKLSSWYLDRELGNKQDSRDKSGSRGRSGAYESEKRKMLSKILDNENSQSRSKSKDEKPYDGEIEKMMDRDSGSYERREGSQEKDLESSEMLKPLGADAMYQMLSIKLKNMVM